MEGIWALRACNSDPVLQRDLMEADGGEEIRGRTGMSGSPGRWWCVRCVCVGWGGEGGAVVLADLSAQGRRSVLETSR